MNVRRAIARLRGISPYSQSRYHETEKLDKELADAYELRTWMEKLWVDKDGIVFIPQMAFKNCVTEAAAFKGLQIPGKGKSTYRKHFESGFIVLEPSSLGIKKQDVPKETYFVPADGVRGSGKRVRKHFPVISEGWEANVVFNVLDPIITQDVFKEHLAEAGMFIGIGRFRPSHNGFYGRFEIMKWKWE
jgi:hypothetical protein